MVKLRDYPGLELRIGKPGSQTQSACPPTPGCDGKPRKWDKHPKPEWLPPHVVTTIMEQARWRNKLTTDPGAGKVIIPPPRENSTPERRYALKALKEEVMLVQHASEGNRNETLNKAAFNLGRLTQPGMLSSGGD